MVIMMIMFIAYISNDNFFLTVQLLPTQLLEVNLNANIVTCIKGKHILKCKLIFCMFLKDIGSNSDLTK